MKKFLLLIIKGYQKYLSLDKQIFRPFFPGGVCRYYPTCSRYAQEAIESYGVRHGLKLTLLRLCRCHPFAAGGYDPVPENKESQ